MLAKQLEATTGAVLVPSADHVDIVLGQATAIREFLEQAADLEDFLDAIIVPSGGGGLLVGAVSVCKPRGVTVFGAEPENGGPGLASALRTGHRSLDLSGAPTIADGLRSLTGAMNWEHIKQNGNVEQVFTVSEDQIKTSLRLASEELGFIIEPSAAVALAVALFNPAFARWSSTFNRGARVGIVLTGGNIGANEALQLLRVTNSV